MHEKMTMDYEYTTEEKARRIVEIVKRVADMSEFGVADLAALRHQCARIKIDTDELQQYLARLKSEGLIGAEAIGSNFYIIPKSL